MTVENDTISWPNGADIDPDVLYLQLPPNATQAVSCSPRSSQVEM
jgi:hypothetical protein